MISGTPGGIAPKREKIRPIIGCTVADICVPTQKDRVTAIFIYHKTHTRIDVAG